MLLQHVHIWNLFIRGKTWFKWDGSMNLGWVPFSCLFTVSVINIRTSFSVSSHSPILFQFIVCWPVETINIETKLLLTYYTTYVCRANQIAAWSNAAMVSLSHRTWIKTNINLPIVKIVQFPVLEFALFLLVCSLARRICWSIAVLAFWW